MSSKTKIASILEQSPGEIRSGEQLAKMLGISRTAVWKNIKALMEEGYPIATIPQKGYLLERPTDFLSSELILESLSTRILGRPIFVHQTLESTNEEAKKRAREGEAHGALVVAEEQTRGKGRQGKSFFSPKGKGIYMSLLLRPEGSPQEALRLTLQAGVAVTDVLRTLYPDALKEKVTIKWVNDVFVGEDKVAGILTEAAMEMESGKLEYLVLGIGINVQGDRKDFPESIQDTAAFLSQTQEEGPTRNLLIARILNRLEELVEKEPFEQTMNTYRERSYLTGKEIRFRKGEHLFEGRVIGVNDVGALEVVTGTGEQLQLQSGEVELLKRNQGGLHQ